VSAASPCSKTTLAVALLVGSFRHDLHVGNLSENLINNFTAQVFGDVDIF
jgi:hypothetical protein